MILKKIQSQIERLYQFEARFDVEKFTLPAGNHSGKEALLVRESSEAIEVGLFIEPSILNLLQTEDPYRHLDEHNLNAFCISAEGVSHFLYFIQHAEENRPLTQLELELQAEVDKYLLSCLLYRQCSGEIPTFLFHSLFENFSLEKYLNPAQKNRYEEANRLAGKFCARLDKNFMRKGQLDSAIEAARHFYHLNHWAKIRSLTP